MNVSLAIGRLLFARAAKETSDFSDENEGFSDPGGVVVARYDRCEFCQGSGECWAGWQTCQACKGEGIRRLDS